MNYDNESTVFGDKGADNSAFLTNNSFREIFEDSQFKYFLYSQFGFGKSAASGNHFQQQYIKQ